MPTLPYFDRLQIAPTNDTKTIKRAYAVALKSIDQQNEREAFEALRKAYEQALAWAASHDDEEEYEDEEDREDEEEYEREDEDDDAPEGGARPPAVPSRSGIGTGKSPDAMPNPGLASPDPSGLAQGGYGRGGYTPDQAALAQARNDMVQRHETIQEWLNRLFDPREASPAVLLDKALKDVRMAHLDSQSQLEGRIADGLYGKPYGRAALFDAAAQRFGWTARHVNPAGSTAAADWISRVVNQDLQWRELDKAAQASQDAAIKAAAATPSPSRAQAYQHASTLAAIHARCPEWLALRLPEGRVRAWQETHAGMSRLKLRMTALKQRFAGNRAKLRRTLVVAVVLLLMLQGFVQSAINGTLFGSDTSSPPTQVDAGKVPETSDAETPEGPVLAYEFTGAVTKDSCETAHEFVHESNWLDQDDVSANALLTTRVLLCQDQNLWPQASDPLTACLRAERLAALSAGRAEDNKHCEAVQGATKKAP